MIFMMWHKNLSEATILQLILLEEITIELTFGSMLKVSLCRKYADLCDKVDNFDFYLVITKISNNATMTVSITITE